MKPGKPILRPWVLWTALALGALMALTTRSCTIVDQYDHRTQEQQDHEKARRYHVD